ncbi:hypothetical protein [Planctomicrobium piriforme]|uniref:Uncharacterized protein n=1 Tax=Planctomicrobium piriforme TaxID=1576369 RepID=A0A1I3L149_9PLAN|nr:hypothetical protein [Planctomicrobium piriforme]SFI78421.1 hypothetical protein SAMN05421753_112106 [Planctomicrobium piriforme]
MTWRFWTAFILIFCGPIAWGEEPPAKPAAAKPSAAPHQRIRKIETLLQMPAQLTLEPHSRITFAELLQQIEETHGLSVRFDRNVLLSFATLMQSTLIIGDEPLEEVSQAPATLDPSPAVVSLSEQAKVSRLPQPVTSSQKVRHTLVELNSPAGPMDAAAAIPASPVPAVAAPDAEPATPETAEPAPPEDEPTGRMHMLSRLSELILETEIGTDAIRGGDLTIEDVLQIAIAQIATPLDSMSLEGGVFPVTASHAYDLDLLVTPSGVEITTRLACHLHKETRVYRISQLDFAEPDELRDVIVKTVRPWSWKSQVSELIEQVTLDLPDFLQLPNMPKIKVDLSGDTPAIESAEVEAEPASEPAPPSQFDTQALKAFGSLLSTGSTAAIEGMIAAIQVAHHAEPPTGTIETLPGLLIITQSQAAHREIADLLEQLGAE